MTLKSFLTSAQIITCTKACEVFGDLMFEDFPARTRVVTFHQDRAWATLDNGVFSAPVGNTSYDSPRLGEVAAPLYFEFYVSEVMDPEDWSTETLTTLLEEYTEWRGLKIASADEMLHTLLVVEPAERTCESELAAAWLDWFIDLWGEVQAREDASQQQVWTYVVFDGNGAFTTGVCSSKHRAEHAVLRKIQADYAGQPGCPTTYDDDRCSAFTIAMGDGMVWQIKQQTVVV